MKIIRITGLALLLAVLSAGTVIAQRWNPNLADFVLTLDFSADQTNSPVQSPPPAWLRFTGRPWGIAYLVNTTDVVIAFPASLGGGIWSGWNLLYSDEFRRRAAREIQAGVNENTHPGTFRLQPGERVRLFCYAFTTENRARYPYSYFVG